MAAVITSTDSPEAIKASFAGKKVDVQVHDEAGTDVTLAGTGVVSTDQTDAAAEGDKDNAAPSKEGESTGDSAAPGKDKEPPQDKDSKADKRIDALIKQNNDLVAQLKAAAPKDPAKPDAAPAPDPKSDAEPQAEDYETQGEYLKALSKWAAKEARKETKAEQDKEAVKARNAQVLEGWKAQVVEGKKAHKDWDDVMTEGVVIGKTAATTLMQLPDGAEIAYYMGKNPETVEELKKLSSDREIIVFIGELRSKVKALAPAKDTTKDAAGAKDKPKPITPLGGTSSGNVEKQAKDMTYPEYKAQRNKEIAAKRKSA